MLVSVLLFASLRDAAGDRIEVRLDAAPATVADLLQQCAAQYPRLAPWIPHLRVAVNLLYAGPEQIVADGDEVAFIPPVSGGAR
jgi:molybdopterin synthase catalytic subunit